MTVDPLVVSELGRLGATLVGGLVGLLSALLLAMRLEARQRLLESERRAREANELQITINLELIEIRWIMVQWAYRTAMLLDTPAGADEALARLLAVADRYDGPNKLKGLDKIRSIGGRPAHERHAAVAAGNTLDVAAGIAIGVPPATMGFLATAIPRLTLCPAGYQRAILDLYRRIDRYNDLVRERKGMVDRTLDSSLSEQNRQALESNLDKVTTLVWKTAVGIVDRITGTLADNATNSLGATLST